MEKMSRAVGLICVRCHINGSRWMLSLHDSMAGRHHCGNGTRSQIPLSYVSHTNASKSCCAHSRTFKKGEEEKDDCRVGPATTAGLRKQLRTPVTTGRNLIMENRARCNASIWSLPPVIGRPRLTFSPFFSFSGSLRWKILDLFVSLRPFSARGPLSLSLYTVEVCNLIWDSPTSHKTRSLSLSFTSFFLFLEAATLLGLVRARLSSRLRERGGHHLQLNYNPYLFITRGSICLPQVLQQQQRGRMFHTTSSLKSICRK